MIVKVHLDEICPYCHQSAEIVHIRTSELVVCQCDSCQRVWMIFREETNRMIRLTENGPDTNDENMLCPRCWRILEPNRETWQLECKDPTCGYSSRLPDLSPTQRETRKGYLKLRQEVFKIGLDGEIPPMDLIKELERLRSDYSKVKRYDYNPIK